MTSKFDVAFVSYGPTAKDGGYKTRIVSQIATLQQYKRSLEISWIAFDAEYAMRQHQTKLQQLQQTMKIKGVKFVIHAIPQWAEPAPIRAIYIMAWLLWDTLRLKPRILHVQSHSAGYFAYPVSVLTRTPFVLDVHGVTPAERRYGMEDIQKTYRDYLLEWLDTFLISHAHGLLFVSNYMAEHYRPYTRSHYVIVPCCVDTVLFAPSQQARERIRKELNLEDRFCVIYSGSFFDKWQEPQDIARFFQAFHLANPAALMVVLSNDDPAKVADFVARYELSPEAIFVRQANHADVPKWLAAADAGLLVRRIDPVNQVASPTKFAEYLACGLPVVITEGIGDYSDLVRAAQIGYVLQPQVWHNTENMAGILAALKAPEVHQRCRIVATEMLSWNVHAEHVFAIYEAASHAA